MKITVKVLTARLLGKKVEQKDVELETTGVSLAEALAAAGVPTEGMQVSINGTPVSDQSLHVKDGAMIELSKAPKSPRSKPHVQVTERASGS